MFRSRKPKRYRVIVNLARIMINESGLISNEILNIASVICDARHSRIQLNRRVLFVAQDLRINRLDKSYQRGTIVARKARFSRNASLAESSHELWDIMLS